jgi:stage II sporulation protein AA (anti-sigma F factor antagonist)
MDIVESTADGVLTLALTGKLDADSTDKFAAALAAVIDRGERRFVLNLAGLDYISSVGLRALIVGAKRLSPLGGKIVLCAPQPRIRQVLEISGFTSIFTIAATADEAAKGLQ